jgi:HEAT repeat protein
VAIIDGQVVRDAQHPEFTVLPLGARLVSSVASRQLADAKSRKVTVQDAKQLAVALRDANPLYRANAIAQLLGRGNLSSQEYVPLLTESLNDHNRRLRCTALTVLMQFKDNDLVVPLLKQRLKDTDHYVRYVAMFDLARRGSVPEIALLRDFFRRADHGNFPFGADSSVGVQASHNAMQIALAPHATKEIFQLLLQKPPRRGDWENGTQMFPELGKSLLRHHDAVAILLQVRGDEGTHDPQVEFVRDVFQSAGKELLPTLHAALQSEDRVIRSNAARGCGAIHDPSSIEPLIKALDLESGLSRASIVWALGELRAKVALPAMARMYVDARNDEQRRGSSGSGAGFRASQSGAVMAAQFESLSNLDAIGADWNDLKSTTFASPIDPRHQEELFEPRHVLEAVAKIGGDESQSFYRTLAAESDDEFRIEAAVQLASSLPKDRKLNIPVLKSLLTSQSAKVRAAAAASLLILGQEDGRQPILDALASPEWGHALEQLQRVGPGQCSFARKEIKAIADDSTKAEVIRDRANALLATQARQVPSQ